MAFISPRMSLKVWNSGSDPYNHEQLADNFLKLDQHDHSSGRGVQIGGDGIRNGAITTEHILPGSLGPELFENPVVHTSLAALTPVDGDEVLFQTAAMATDGVMWRLRYNEASTDPQDYKWEFVGGGALYSNNATYSTRSVASQTWTVHAAGDPQISIPLAGRYAVSSSATLAPMTTGSIKLSCGVSNGANPSAGESPEGYIVGAGTNVTVSLAMTSQYWIASSPPTNLSQVYWQGHTSAQDLGFRARYLTAIPIKVKSD
jgi:hypothetical protein